jgi:hypothetical protein
MTEQSIVTITIKAQVTQELAARMSETASRPLNKRRPDEGLWFLAEKGVKYSVQMESVSYTAPQPEVGMTSKQLANAVASHPNSHVVLSIGGAVYLAGAFTALIGTTPREVIIETGDCLFNGIELETYLAENDGEGRVQLYHNQEDISVWYELKEVIPRGNLLMLVAGEVICC